MRIIPREYARGEYMTETDALHQLALECGVQTEYFDCDGRRRVASEDALVAVLQALEVPLCNPAGAGNALLEMRNSEQQRLCPPVLVAWQGRPEAFPLRRVGNEKHHPLEGRLELEDGAELSCTLEVAEENSHQEQVSVRTPASLPLGVHTLRLQTSDRYTSATILSAPDRCFGSGIEAKSGLGVFLPLYALHDSRSWGVGDFRVLHELQKWAATLGCAHVSTLPLLACFLDEPFEPSPYVPVTRFFWNELFLDLAGAPELEQCVSARKLLSSESFQRELGRLREMEYVDYRRVAALKRKVLDELSSAAFQCSARRGELEKYVRATPQLDQYARFRALTERRLETWPAWPKPLCRSDLGAGDGTRQWRRHIYAQFLLMQQLDLIAKGGTGEGLSLDLPIGVHPAGFDAWRWRKLFVDGASAGAPPDSFFSRGQNWGFRPQQPRHSRETGHEYFRHALLNHLRFAGLLRVDHVMSLHRLFWIPDGFDPADGVYVRYPAQELYAILCLESHRAGARIVGEDLGTVPPEVQTEMSRRGLLSTKVAQSQLRAHQEWPIAPMPRQALTTVNTHDMPPWKSFWSGSDIQLRQSMGLLQSGEEEIRERKELRKTLAAFLELDDSTSETDAGQALEALLKRLAAGPALELLVNLEDLWLEERPQNVPGVRDYPSWRRKTILSLEEIQADDRISELLRELGALRREGPRQAGEGH